MLVRRTIFKAALTLLLGLAAALAHAQTVKMYGDGEKPSAQEIADILAASLRSKTRGVKLTGNSEPASSSSIKLIEANASNAEKTVSNAEVNAFALPIQFAFDSAKILPIAYEQLDAVAEGLKLLNDQVTMMIEGHTDAHGKVAYNKSLSVRRADSVRRYFVDKHGIDIQLLKAEGRGSSDPINKANPYSGENRRVQFRAG